MEKPILVVFFATALASRAPCQDPAASFVQKGSPAWERRRNALSGGLDGLTRKATPFLDQALYDMHHKKWTGALSNCEQAEEILRSAPMLAQIAQDERAQVLLAEGKDQGALNIWQPMLTGDRSPTPLMALDMSLAYANLGEPQLARPLFKVLEDHWFQGYKEGFDQDRLPIANGYTSANVRASAYFLRAFMASDGRYPEARFEDLQKAFALAPHNGNIAYWIADEIHLRQQKANASVPFYQLAYQFGGPVIRNSASNWLSQIHSANSESITVIVNGKATNTVKNNP